MATEEPRGRLQDPVPVLIDGCVPGWIVFRLSTDHVHVRNAISGQLEKLHAERVTPRDLELPTHFQAVGETRL